MTTLAVLIWVWSLVILPFTAILTFILTLVTCSLVPNNAPKTIKFPEISELGTGEAHIYFIIGFVVLSLQLLVILIGRLQFLFQTQLIINRIRLCLVHLIALISSVFMFIMAIISQDDDAYLHLVGAFGTFVCISLYCFLHTIVVVYLFKRRSDAPEHAGIIYPIWFLIFSVLLIAFFITWFITDKSIPQYIAAASSFLYMLGFVPQFWSRARTRKRDSIVLSMIKTYDEVDV